jgi:hypothetical protein
MKSTFSEAVLFAEFQVESQIFQKAPVLRAGGEGENVGKLRAKKCEILTLIGGAGARCRVARWSDQVP